jgi:hypothetical protein
MSQQRVSMGWVIIGLLLALGAAFYAWPAILAIVALYSVYKSFKKRPSTTESRALFLGLAALVVVGGAAVQIPWSRQFHDSASSTPSQASRAGTPSPETTRPTKATFSARVASAVPDSTSMSIAQVVVTNTSAVAGVPYCKVKLRDATGVFKGSDLFEFRSVAPGATETFNAEIIVENEGALYVSIGEADCTG